MSVLFGLDPVFCSLLVVGSGQDVGEKYTMNIVAPRRREGSPTRVGLATHLKQRVAMGIARGEVGWGREENGVCVHGCVY